MLKIIIALYSNTSSCVKLNHVCSDTFLLHKGLRQGDSLPPVLFIFYINKLASFRDAAVIALSDGFHP